MKSDRFQKYDYGYLSNIIKYRSVSNIFFAFILQEPWTQTGDITAIYFAIRFGIL